MMARSDGEPVVVLGRMQSREVFPGHGAELSALSFKHGDPKQQVVLDVPQLLPVPPAWDIIKGIGPPFWAVLERAGGALNALILTEPGGETIGVSEAHPFAHFALPRFARGEMGSWPSVTAIRDNRDGVLFTYEGSGRYGSALGLCACSQALVLRRGERITLLFKVDGAGPARFGFLPGNLYVVDLNRDLSFATDPILLTPARGAFEFDADVFGEDDAVVATIASGAVVIVVGGRTRSLAAYAVTGSFVPDAVARPALATSPSGLTLALLEAPGHEQARLHVGAFSPPR